MDLPWTIDEVARTTDEDFVRRRFEQRNRVWLIVLLSCFTFVAFIELVANDRQQTPLGVGISSLNLALCAFGLFFMRYASKPELPGRELTSRVGAWLRKRTNAVVLAYVAIQYVLAIAFAQRGDQWMGWVITMPLFMLGFRMAATELALLHCVLLGGGLLMIFIAPPPAPAFVPMIISPIVINLIALSVELFMSRRMRATVLDEWTSRRTQARDQIRMRDELRYARELQLSMLPECAPTLPWADICSISLPATEVGGDYYDYFVDEGRVALVCGDVAGHGMAAGLVLASIRSGFTLLRESLSDPALVLRRLHTLVAETSRRRMLVTVSVVLVDRTTNEATIASAGNPPVILRRANGDMETIDLFAPPLGVRLPVDIPQRRLAIASGDVIVLHSDGIYETRNASDQTYGLERLANVIREHGTSTAESLRDAILFDVATFRGTAEQDDDVTLVVCRMT